MPTKIQATLFEDAEAFLREEIDGFISTLGMDHVTSFRLRHYSIQDMMFEIEDTEDGTTKQLTLEDLIKALQLLCDGLGVNFHYSLLKPTDLKDPGNWDVEIVDAFFQLAFFGEVIYG